MMQMEPQRIPLVILPNHLDYITNLLTTANLRYIDTAPILADIGRQVQAFEQEQRAKAVADATSQQEDAARRMAELATQTAKDKKGNGAAAKE